MFDNLTFLHRIRDTPQWFCVFLRMLEYSLDLQNVSFSAVRTVRVLRPLRAINRVPSKSDPNSSLLGPALWIHAPKTEGQTQRL